MRSRRKSIVLFFAILILALVMIISGLQILGSAGFFAKEGAEQVPAAHKIVKDGKTYVPRYDLNVVMILGIDQTGPAVSSGYHQNPGAADMVALLVFDETDKSYDILYLNRDTIMDVTVLGLYGKEAGTSREQLALAHTYGSGMEDSCLNVVNTLQNFMPGLTIDHYISMNLDALPLLNDAVGGVTVNVVDDFSEVDPTITKGKVTLRGEQVLHFVQTRKGVGDQQNTSRMDRQKEYISAFMAQYKKSEDLGVEHWLAEYQKISPYVVTDCSTTDLSNMLSEYSDYTLGETITIDGDVVLENAYYEFHADPASVEDIMLKLFYKEKK